MNGERVWFCGGSVGMELVQGEWRRLNTESPDDDEQAAKLWARRGMEWELSVVTSTAEHCDIARLVCGRRAAERLSALMYPMMTLSDCELSLKGLG
jgi:hypothetical protein